MPFLDLVLAVITIGSGIGFFILEWNELSRSSVVTKCPSAKKCFLGDVCESRDESDVNPKCFIHMTRFDKHGIINHGTNAVIDTSGRRESAGVPENQPSSDVAGGTSPKES